MRRPERIPKVMRFFRKNTIAFSEFINVDTEDVMFLTYRSNFERNYEDLFYEFISCPDLRFGQLLINKGIIPDGTCWNIEETNWLITHKWMKPEEILLWGSLGVEREKKFNEWIEDIPKLNDKVESWEKKYYEGDKNYVIFAKRYKKWEERRPKYTYSFIENLEKEHIENILKDCSLTPFHELAFKNMLEKYGF